MCSANVYILWEGIDFHCYGYILMNISKRTGYGREMIKEYIWNIESAWNDRKEKTKMKSNEYKRKKEWEQIKRELDKEREKIVERL
jgi:hypothetical protein